MVFVWTCPRTHSSFGVIHGFMGGIVIRNAPVGGPFIRHDGFGCRIGMLFDGGVEGFSGSPSSHFQPNGTAALNGSNYQTMQLFSRIGI